MRYAKSRLRHCKQADFDAEDVVQEAYIKIIKYIDRIDFSVGDNSLKSYLFSVIDNKTKDMIAKLKPHENIDDYHDALEDDEDFFAHLHEKENADIVRAALKQLPVIYMITLRYRFYTELSIKDIADLMEVSENTVKSRILRGKQMLWNAIRRGDIT